MASSHGTQAARSTGRTFVIAGPNPSGEIPAITRAIAAQRGELVVLATGWPPTPAQQQLIGEAMRHFADLGLPVGARLLYSEDEIEDHLRPGDTIILPSVVQSLDEPAFPAAPSPAYAAAERR